jgi:hypothetical protein
LNPWSARSTTFCCSSLSCSLMEGEGCGGGDKRTRGDAYGGGACTL